MSFARSGFASLIAGDSNRLHCRPGLTLVAWGYTVRETGVGLSRRILGLAPLGLFAGRPTCPTGPRS